MLYCWHRPGHYNSSYLALCTLSPSPFCSLVRLVVTVFLLYEQAKAREVNPVTEKTEWGFEPEPFACVIFLFKATAASLIPALFTDVLSTMLNTQFYRH